MPDPTKGLFLDIVWRWVSRSCKIALIIGCVAGAILGTLYAPIFGTLLGVLLGCIFGGITGLVVGVTNGVLSGLITRWFFTPPFSSTRYALTLAGVSGVGSVLGCWLVVSPFINMLSMDRASYRGLFSLNPMLLIIVIPVAIWESQNFARWYEWQLPS